MNTSKKEIGRAARHHSIRKRVIGSTERPRLAVHRSAKNIYVQVIDDFTSKTLFAFSTRDKDFVKAAQKINKVAKAQKLGQVFGPKMKEKGITKIAFDRGGYKYHGRVKALAESLRASGIQF